MKVKNVISLFLALMTVTACSAGCSKGGGTESTETTTQTQAEVTDNTVPTETTAADEEPYVFVFSGAGGYNPANHIGTALEYELNGIYEEVGEVCGVEIVFLDMPSDADSIITSAASGSKYADIAKVRQTTWIPLAVKGYIYPLDTQEMRDAGLDIHDPDCFFQPFTALGSLVLNGETQIWAADISGKYDRMNFGHTYAFNKNLLAAKGYTEYSMFSLVYDNEWTYDKMIDIASEFSEDLNNDGALDIWGIALDCDGNEVWTNGTGPIVMNPSTGLWESNCLDSRIIASLEFMGKLNSDGMLSPSLLGSAVYGRGDRRTLFYSGKAAFAGLYGRNYGFDGIENGTAAMADGAGLLPIPRGPDTNHYTMNYMDVDSLCIPVSGVNLSKAAKTLNEIGRRVHDDGEYFDYILHESLLGCEDSFKVLTEYLMPYGMMNIAKCSDAMYDITRRQFFKSVYEGSMSPTQAAATFDPLIAAELSRVFNQE